MEETQRATSSAPHPSKARRMGRGRTPRLKAQSSPRARALISLDQ